MTDVLEVQFLEVTFILPPNVVQGKVLEGKLCPKLNTCRDLPSISSLRRIYIACTATLFLI